MTSEFLVEFKNVLLPVLPGIRSYDVSPDGQSFVMVQPAESQEGQLVWINNWFEELKRLAPAE